jgi:hypothetical protein
VHHAGVVFPVNKSAAAIISPLVEVRDDLTGKKRSLAISKEGSCN